VLCGATGSAKTRVLHAMALQGRQVLDLEGLAVHKGSLLGAVPGMPQPSQTAFETRIASVLERIDPALPLYVEGESRRIGRLDVPLPLVTRMRASSCIEIVAAPETRLAYLLRDYAYLGDDPQALSRQLGLLKELHGKAVIARWQQWAAAGELPHLFAELTALHYDPAYRRSQANHFARWPDRRLVMADDLSDGAIEALARRVAELG
jgi:tRNA 2-selenouridine synthase